MNTAFPHNLKRFEVFHSIAKWKYSQQNCSRFFLLNRPLVYSFVVLGWDITEIGTYYELSNLIYRFIHRSYGMWKIHRQTVETAWYTLISLVFFSIAYKHSESLLNCFIWFWPKIWRSVPFRSTSILKFISSFVLDINNIFQPKRVKEQKHSNHDNEIKCFMEKTHMSLKLK